MKIGFICHILGHDMFNTYYIDEYGDSFDVNDATYCSRCGKINPQANKLHKITCFFKSIIIRIWGKINFGEELEWQ